MKMMNARHIFVAAVCALALATPPTVRAVAGPGPAGAYCQYPYLINWPASPVWSLCWAPPPGSSGLNGSGLEIYQAFFKGHRVFWRANMPVLNVKYDPGGCGGVNLSYRDWLNQYAAFDANNVVMPGYAEPTVPPTTVMDHPGYDSGSFSGVALQKLSDRIILTTQMQAGWYRYVEKWTFYLNGTIEPRMGFTTVNSPCVNKPHFHHAYYRFDFDIDSYANNRVDRCFGLFCTWTGILTEAKTVRSYVPSNRWRARNLGSGRGYVIVDGGLDGVAATSFADADRWDLRYHYNEMDDGGSTSGPNADAIHIDKYLNGESVNGQDIVVWYRGGYYHTDPSKVGLIGPTLKPFGQW